LVAWAERSIQGARRADLEGLADDTLADPRDSHTIVRRVRSPASGIATLTCAPRYSTTETLNTERRLVLRCANPN
jgi:hypothetical protein